MMKPFYRKYQGGYAAIVGGVLAVGGAVIGADSARSAANKQADGANQANDTQRYMYDQTRADNTDFMNNGRAGSNALAYRLGLNTAPTGAKAGVDYSAAPNTYIAGQSNNPLWEKVLAQFNADHKARFGINMNRDWNSDNGAMGAKAQLDAQYKAALATDPEMQALIGKQNQQQTTQQTTANNDPNYGSLLRNFTVDDFNADPVNQLSFKYGADQGAQEINRRASATGSSDSGAILKALDRFRTDYIGSKAGESANRFNVNRDSQFNKLAAQAGTGQVATQQVGTTGMNAANNISQNQIGVGNARGASAIATGNALSGAATGYYNNYQQNRLIDGYLNRNTGGSGYVGSNDHYANSDLLTS